MPESKLEQRYFTVNDKLVSLFAQLVDGAGNALDITGQTITFRMIKRSDGSVKINNAAAVIVTPTTGQVRYNWATADVDTAGVYHGYFRRDSGGNIATHPVDGPHLEIHFVAT